MLQFSKELVKLLLPLKYGQWKGKILQILYVRLMCYSLSSCSPRIDKFPETCLCFVLLARYVCKSSPHWYI